jgi:hypothetical protein
MIDYCIVLLRQSTFVNDFWADYDGKDSFGFQKILTVEL